MNLNNFPEPNPTIYNTKGYIQEDLLQFACLAEVHYHTLKLLYLWISVFYVCLDLYTNSFAYEKVQSEEPQIPPFQLLLHVW